MPIGTDIRQAVIVALESQGADALTIISDAIAELQKRQLDLTSAFESGAVASASYVKSMQALEAEVVKLKGMYDEAGNSFDSAAAIQKKLGEMEKQAARDTQEAVASSAAARRQGTESIVEHIAKTREEIAAEEASRVAGIKAMGDRAQAYAREEQALEELNAQLARNQQAREKEAAAAQWVTRQATELNRVLDALADHERTAATATVTHTAAMNSSAAAAARLGDQGQKGGQAAARGFLELSRAVEDFAVAGPLGALNNIPGIAQSIGQSFNASAGAVAGWTTVVSIAATSAYVLYQNWDTVRRAFDGGIGPKIIEDIKFVSDHLKELEEKTYKARVDYQDIANLKEELRLLREAESAYNRAKSKTTEDQDEASKILTEGIGSDADKVARGVVAATPKADSVETINAKAAVDELQKKLQEQMSSLLPHVLAQAPITQVRLGSASSALEAARGADKKARDEAAANLVGRALTGKDEAARAGLDDLIRNSPEKFRAVGVDTGKVGQSLRDASPQGIANRKRIDEDYEESIRKTDDSIRGVKGRFDEIRKGAKAREKKDEEVRRAEEAAADQNRRLDHQRMVEGNKAEQAKAAAFGKLKNVGTGEAQRVRQQNLGQIFQQETGANDETSMAAGKGMDASMSKGFSMQQAFLMEIRKLNAIISRQNADLEAASEAFGQGAEAMGQISAQASLARRRSAFNGMNMGRTTVQAPSLLSRGSN